MSPTFKLKTMNRLNWFYFIIQTFLLNKNKCDLEHKDRKKLQVAIVKTDVPNIKDSVFGFQLLL